MAKYMANIL